MSGVNLLLDPTKWAVLNSSGYEAPVVQGSSPPPEWISFNSDYEITSTGGSATSSVNPSTPIEGYILAYTGTPSAGDFVAFTMTNNDSSPGGHIYANIFNTWSLDAYTRLLLPANPNFTVLINTGGAPKTCTYGPFATTDSPCIVVNQINLA